MKRYDLQDGDGIHITGRSELMLVMNEGRLTISEFDVGELRLEFYWLRAEPYPVSRDARGFYVEVDEDTWDELVGSSPWTANTAGDRG